MQHAIEAYLDPCQPGGNVTSQPKGDAATDHPPHSGADNQAARRRCRTKIGVHRPEADTRSQQAEQQLNCDYQDDAAEDRSPRDPPVNMIKITTRGGCRVKDARSPKGWCLIGLAVFEPSVVAPGSALEADPEIPMPSKAMATATKTLR
jgi:hypothetical protein